VVLSNCEDLDSSNENYRKINGKLKLSNKHLENELEGIGDLKTCK